MYLCVKGIDFLSRKVDQNVDLSVIKRVVDEKINLVTQQLRCEPSSKVEDLLGIDIRQVKDLCNLNIESVQNLKGTWSILLYQSHYYARKYLAEQNF